MVDKLERASLRGNEAYSLLNNELLKESFDILKKKIEQEWRESKPAEAQRRDDAWRMLKAIECVEGYLKSVITNGKIAKKKITDLNKKTKFNI